MPRAAEDKTQRGQSYGAETAQQKFKAATSGGPQAQLDFTTPEVPEDMEDEGLPPEELAPVDLEIPGLGNLGEILYADTERPWEDPNTAPTGTPYRPGDEGPQGPPREYQDIMRDPRISSSTRALVSFISRIRMMQPTE
jgi:hypothetical protein